MSTQPISSGLTPTSTLSSLSGSGTGLQITGLASGLDTNAIISALMAVERQPVAHLTNQQTGIQALNTALAGIQSSLRTVALNAQALGDPGLFATTQSVTSSNSAVVSATTVTGAGVGGYQVGVTQLANSSQRTYSFTSPSAADTITIDGHQTAIAAGATVQDLAAAINSDSSATVYAAATSSGTVVLSSRATGDTGSSFIQVSDPASALSEQTALARQGKDAMYSVDGVSASSSSNIVTGAIAGVTLTFGGITTPTTGTVTVAVQAPAASTSSVQAAVQKFLTSYNSVIDQINGNLTQKRSSSNTSVGQLFGDNQLTSLLGNMRTGMYASGAGLPAGMASLADIGITTGAASGAAAFSADSVAGKLTVDPTALAAAIQSNPTGVAQALQSWSQSFSQIVNAQAAPGSAIDTRMQGDTSQINSIANRISSLNEMLTNRQTALQAQFAKLEATLSQYQSQGNWLTAQLNALNKTA